MSDLSEIQRLIRLKRYENPPEDFVEHFIEGLKERQRAELLQKSSLELFFERVSTYFEPVSTPQWAMAGGAVALVALMLMASIFTAPQAQVLVQTIPSAEPSIRATPRIQAPASPNRAVTLAQSTDVVGPVASEAVGFGVGAVLIGGSSGAAENQTVPETQLLSRHFNGGDIETVPSSGWFDIGSPTRDMLLPAGYDPSN